MSNVLFNIFYPFSEVLTIFYMYGHISFAYE